MLSSLALQMPIRGFVGMSAGMAFTEDMAHGLLMILNGQTPQLVGRKLSSVLSRC